MVLLAIAAGVVVGYARGGRVRRLVSQRPMRSRLLLTALLLYVLGVLGGWAWEPLLPILTALGGLVIAYFAWLNRHFEGALLVALGMATNALVVLLNGAMPISTDAVARSGAAAADLTDSRYVDVADAVLPWLGKIVPVALPGAPEVVSPGDIALAAGCGLIVATSMLVARHRMVRPHPSDGELPGEAASRPAEPSVRVPPAPRPAPAAEKASASMANVPAAQHEAAGPPRQAGTG